MVSTERRLNKFQSSLFFYKVRKMPRVKQEREKKSWKFTDRRQHSLKVARKSKNIYIELGKAEYIKKHGHPLRKQDVK